MRIFTQEEVEKYIKYQDENVLPLDQWLGTCHMCGDNLNELKLPEGPEKKIVCLKDRQYFVEAYEELEEYDEL